VGLDGFKPLPRVPIKADVEPESVIIIGGGPAAYTAAVYAARARLSPLCIEGFGAGGQLLTTGTVENFPSYHDGVLGPELATDLRTHAERFGARFLLRDVTSVDLSQRPFSVFVGEQEHRARALIVATGATPRKLGLPGEEELQGRGIAYCSVCDGALFRGRRVMVVGGGDAALEEAIGLTKFASEVLLVHRRRAFRASRIMQEYAAAQERITTLTPYVVEELMGREGGRLTGVKLRDTETGSSRVQAVDGLFVSIGHEPASELFQPFLAHDSHGFLWVDPGSARTSVEGVFAAGDVADKVYRQAITAAGTGTMAALDAERWLLRTAGGTQVEGGPTPAWTAGVVAS
jgi:thioredoxin reductase (NADPH)